jgi:hypothetical protein
LRYLLALLGFVTVLWSFGVQPYADLSSLLPYMTHVQIRRYAPPIWELAASISACFGLEALGRDRRSRIALVAGGGAVLGLGTVILLGRAGSIVGAISRAYPKEHLWAIGSVAWAGGAVVLVTAVGLIGGRRPWSKALVGALLIIDAGAMAFVPQLSAPTASTVDMSPVRYLEHHLGFGRYFSFRAYHSDYGSYFGLASVNTSDAPVPQAWFNEIRSRLGSNAIPWSFDGVHVTNPAGPGPITEALANIRAYEALDVRYFVVLDPLPPDLSQRGSLLGLRKVFDDGFVSILSLPDPTPYFTTAGASCTVRSPTRDLAVTSCTRPATLVRSELDLPDSSATVNGDPRPVHDYHDLVTSVRVPAGRSVVRFSYSPPGITPALVGFLAGVLLIVGLPGSRLVRRRGV